MKKIAFLILLAVVLVSASCSQRNYVSVVNGRSLPAVPQQMLRDSLPALEKKCAWALSTAYMADSCLGTFNNVKGWEGYPVKLYQYYTPVDVEVKQPKKGLVYMLNPTPHKLAMWIATTCWVTKGSISSVYTDKLVNWIVYQSNAQFPVAGVVYEDMEGDGTFYPYIFKDGVTVYIASDEWKDLKHDHPTDKMLNFYLHASNSDLQPYTGQYARINSATREQYRNYGGTEDVGSAQPRENRKLEWLDVVKRLYKKAWNSDYNEIMIMWARERL